MPPKKLFKNLSRSQKNRRLCETLAQENEIEVDGVQQHSQVCDENSDQYGAEYCREKYPLNWGEMYVQDNEDKDDETYNEDSNKDDRENQSLTFKEEISQWICHINISHESSKALLQILKNADLNDIKKIPSDPRTLLGTPESTITRSVPPGEYFHYSLKSALSDQLINFDINQVPNDIKININIDELSLSKSSGSQFYPILGQIFPLIDEPFVIAAYHGYQKPHSSNLLLEEFINEYNKLNHVGFEFSNKRFKVTIREISCDSPAKSNATCTKAHNGYFGCRKCRDEGDFNNHQMLFTNLNAPLRNDANFLERIDEEHHTGKSLFQDAGLGMVSQFPLDYMHLVCLRKKILLTFVNGPHQQKFSARIIGEILAHLKDLSKWIPSDFARKYRELNYVDHWKATEFRLFLLYIGQVVLQNYLPTQYMVHFIVLHCAIRILCHKGDCININQYANDLLINFVKNCIPLYGSDFLIYNVHNLIHLANDVLRFEFLNSFSAFPFESFLYTVKKKIKKADKPLQQLHRRIVKRASCHYKNRNVFSKEPKFAGKNKRRTEELGIVSYYTICYKRFKLSLRGDRDRFAYLHNDTIVRIQNISINHQNKPILIGQLLKNSSGLLNYPIDSREFNLVVGNYQFSCA